MENMESTEDREDIAGMVMGSTSMVKQRKGLNRVLEGIPIQVATKIVIMNTAKGG